MCINFEILFFRCCKMYEFKSISQLYQRIQPDKRALKKAHSYRSSYNRQQTISIHKKENNNQIFNIHCSQGICSNKHGKILKNIKFCKRKRNKNSSYVHCGLLKHKKYQHVLSFCVQKQYKNTFSAHILSGTVPVGPTHF